jgi:hypothetical protein
MRTKLQLFQDFSLDMAADFTGLRPGEVNWCRKQRIVTPHKRGASFMYSFTDLLVLRTVRQLKGVKVPVKNIKMAKDYLRGIDSSRSLTNVALYIGDSTGKIYYIGENPQKDVMVELTQGGQLVRSDFVVMLRVGRDLDAMRKDILGQDKTLATRLKSPKLIPLEQGLKKYGLG